MTTRSHSHLSGWRILDLGIITAGAATSALLADAGAEVIKIESEVYPDPFRNWRPGGDSNDGKTRPMFNFTNRNKLGVSLNLKDDGDREVFLTLVQTADAIVENFRRGVLSKLGIDWEVLSKRNPKLVLASISNQGETGPERHYTSYGSTLEATSGLASVTGYEDDRPVITGRNLNYPDQVVSIYAMGLIVAAILSARRAGKGVHLDISQREVSSFMIGEVFAAAAADHAVMGPSGRIGNADPSGCQRGLVRSKDRRWIAVHLSNETLSLEAITAQAANMSIAEFREYAKVRNFGAVPVLRGSEVMDIAAGRMFDKPVGHAFAWSGETSVFKGYPFQSRSHPFSIDRPAPGIGEHNVLLPRSKEC